MRWKRRTAAARYTVKTVLLALTLVLFGQGHARPAPSQEMALHIVPGLPAYGVDPPQWRILVVARGGGTTLETVTPDVRAEGARLVSIHPKRASIADGQCAAFFVHLEGTNQQGSTVVTVRLKEFPTCAKSCNLPFGIDLSQLPWEQWWAGKHVRAGEVQGLPSGARWKPVRLLEQWEEQGVTWVRTKFLIPASWRGLRLRARLRAVDDQDVSFLNGHEIGRTDGWDLERNYELSSGVVRWGKENELCIAVDNRHAGGGIYRTPILIIAGEFEADSTLFGETVLQEESDRAPHGPVGERLPLRRMVVRDGVLQYEDGKEVALWGVNYYPQSWQQYESLKKLGVDHRRSIDEDFDDFVQMGIDIIRIHVFDREISDGEGNLVRNDHLDVLDYLVAQCSRRGIYLMLTPIAWWGSPSALADSFSQNTPKEAMPMWPERWAVQANYLRQFLSHGNPHTGRRLVDEPCLVLFEVINEPTYWSYGEVTSGVPRRSHRQVSNDVSQGGMAGVRATWQAFTRAKEWETPAVFAYFRYDLVRRYINTMIEAMREVGAHQPIAYSAFFTRGNSDLAQAVADSRCDAITLGKYPGGLKKIIDDKNLLGKLDNSALDARFAKKARLVYEFDADGTIRLVNMYPAMARHWRNLGVQVACQFQYDARAAAHLNWDWHIHYLNLWHTPEKMVSFLIGGEVFRRLPRGASFPTPPDDQVFPPGAVSFRHNAALLCAENCYMQARPTDWRPLSVPKQPTRILSVGNTPYFAYDGTGVVDLSVVNGVANLRIYPDVERLHYGLKGTVEKPLTHLHEAEHLFRLRLPGWTHARVERLEKEGWIRVPGSAGEFAARPGFYRLVK